MNMIEIEPLLTSKDIAKILTVSSRQVVERYAMMPGFPTAIRLPSSNGQGVYRWKKEDVLAWINKLQKAA